MVQTAFEVDSESARGRPVQQAQGPGNKLALAGLVALVLIIICVLGMNLRGCQAAGGGKVETPSVLALQEAQAATKVATEEANRLKDVSKKAAEEELVAYNELEQARLVYNELEIEKLVQKLKQLAKLAANKAAAHQVALKEVAAAEDAQAKAAEKAAKDAKDGQENEALTEAATAASKASEAATAAAEAEAEASVAAAALGADGGAAAAAAAEEDADLAKAAEAAAANAKAKTREADIAALEAAFAADAAMPDAAVDTPTESKKCGQKAPDDSCSNIKHGQDCSKFFKTTTKKDEYLGIREDQAVQCVKATVGYKMGLSPCMAIKKGPFCDLPAPDAHVNADGQKPGQDADHASA